MANKPLAADIFIKRNGKNIFICESELDSCGVILRRKSKKSKALDLDDLDNAEPENSNLEYPGDMDAFISE